MKRTSILFSTDAHLTGILSRLTLSIVIFPHGCQMLLGWFGGYGFDASMNYLTQTEKLPAIIGVQVILLQFFGSILLLFGFLSRPVAIAMVVLFTGMILTSHLEHGFFMNWSGQAKGEGFEYHLLVIGLMVVLLINGAGAYSFDRWLTKRYYRKLHKTTQKRRQVAMN